jgi:hypothetical protein
VIDAWNAQRFEFKLAKSWQVTESLYENASPEQKREFYAHLESHAIELVDAIKQGASEATLLRMASDFHFRCVTLPHVAPPPPPPLSEVQRLGPGMIDGNVVRVPYNHLEMD